MRIGIVEDDKRIGNELQIFLERYGYTCLLFDDFENIVETIKATPVDMYLVDINLPIYDGFYLCREIRKFSDTPIIIVTSRDTEMDELMGMQLGADDFVTKPFNTQILLARIESVLRRTTGKIQKEQCHFGGLCLDLSKALATYDNNEVDLTVNELKILHILMQQGGKIVSRDNLMTHLWSEDHFVDDNTLTVNMSRLKNKLSSIGIEKGIETRRGQGYLLNEINNLSK